MIVNVHAHPGVLGHTSDDPGDLPRLADRAGIEMMVVSHCQAIFSDTRAGNDALAAVIRTHADRILGYAAFTSAYYGLAILEEIDRCVFDHGMRGLKVYSHPGR
jgi:predicted TIM-barrel fold metal-dependent hydrolase